MKKFQITQLTYLKRILIDTIKENFNDVIFHIL